MINGVLHGPNTLNYMATLEVMRTGEELGKHLFVLSRSGVRKMSIAFFISLSRVNIQFFTNLYPQSK